MGFGFNSPLGARLQAMGGFPPSANYLPTGDDQPAQKAPAAAAPPPVSAGPAQVPAGASFGPGYIPGIYPGTPGMVDAAPVSTAVGDAAGAAASGGPGVMKLLMSLFGA